MESRRKGKIAKLPVEVRHELNLMLRDNVDASQCVAWLAEKGFGNEWLKRQGFEEWNPQNFTNWVRGDGDGKSGYAEWLRNQERAETIGIRKDAALQMVRTLKNGGEIHITEANELMLAAHINEVLEDFDPQVLKQMMDEKPEKFFQLAMSVNSQTSERTKREKLELEFSKYRDHVEEKKRKIEEALNVAKSKGGLTPETLKTIEEAAAML